MLKKYLEIGKIVNIHALKGEVKVIPWCDSPYLLCELNSLYFKSDNEMLKLKIQNARVIKNCVIVKFCDVDTPQQAEAMRNTILYANRNDIELGENTYFIQDLIGLNVTDADTNKVYGEICDVLQTGANDVYVIKNGDKEYLVPAIADVVLKTDIENKIMRIRPLKGLFDED